MFKQAFLYKDELNKLLAESWDDISNIYWHNTPTPSLMTDSWLNDTKNGQVLVSIENGKIIGMLTYEWDWITRSVGGFGIISFDKGNITFIKDILQEIARLFSIGINRIQWFAYTDNPAVLGYMKFVQRYGGHWVGPLRQVSLLADGKMHDAFIFEVLKEDLSSNFFKRYGT